MLGPEILNQAEELAGIYREAFGAPGYDETEESVLRFRDEQLPTHTSP